jgi:predicted naringenin-chalcone synthase
MVSLQFQDVEWSDAHPLIKRKRKTTKALVELLGLPEQTLDQNSSKLAHLHNMESRICSW